MKNKEHKNKHNELFFSIMHQKTITNSIAIVQLINLKEAHILATNQDFKFLFNLNKKTKITARKKELFNLLTEKATNLNCLDISCCLIKGSKYFVGKYYYSKTVVGLFLMKHEDLPFLDHQLAEDTIKKEFQNKTDLLQILSINIDSQTPISTNTPIKLSTKSSITDSRIAVEDVWLEKTIDYQKINLKSIINQLVEEHKPLVDFIIDPLSPQITGDIFLIRLALNLILKITIDLADKHEKEIMIGFVELERSKEWRIILTDNGNNLNTCFENMPLKVAKKIIEKHGGRLDIIKSEAGFHTFLIDLPQKECKSRVLV